MNEHTLPFIHAEPWRPLPFAAGRESSWSRDGFNRDWREFAAGEELLLADIRGCGFISRLWFAIDTGVAASREHRSKVADPLLLRKTVLRIYWDGADYPSVDVPVGDFFALGHGAMRSFSSALVEVSAHPGDTRGSLISWFRMPFRSGARVVLCNQGEQPLRAFWHVDYQRWERLPADLYHFHASWRCEMPCPPAPLEPGGKEGANLTGDNNYVILDATGEGTYFGCHLSVDNHAGGWWGEGDDMVFVDGEPFPGSLHGTGQEEYFGQGWGMQDVQYPLFGTSLFNHGHRDWEGRWSMYRWHVPDPIPFRRSIRVTLEHGHNNHRADDYSSTAYWYQKGPQPVPALPAVADRLPRTPSAGLDTRSPGSKCPVRSPPPSPIAGR